MEGTCIVMIFVPLLNILNRARENSPHTRSVMCQVVAISPFPMAHYFHFSSRFLMSPRPLTLSRSLFHLVGISGVLPLVSEKLNLSLGYYNVSLWLFQECKRREVSPGHPLHGERGYATKFTAFPLREFWMPVTSC